MTERLAGTAPEDVVRAAALLGAGALVAFPTETVYGLGADARDPAAVARIFAAKGRPADNPLIVHVADVGAALALWNATADERALAQRLGAEFWPGPLSLVLRAAPGLPEAVRGGLDTVAVRVPDHPVALALLRRLGRPLAAPSANRSGRPSPTTAEHVLHSLGDRIAAVLDGGPTRVGLESTVLDLREARPRVLRAGSVSRAAVQAAVGVPVSGPGGPGSGDAHRAPGTRYRHYAPEGLTVVLAGEAEIEAAWTSDAALLCRAALVAAVTARLGPPRGPLEVLPDDAEGYGRGLYAALYRMEASGAGRLLVQRVPASAPWDAVRDRLERASRA